MSSADVASDYVRRMVQSESRGWGDDRNALQRIQSRYGLSFWTLNNLRTGRAKTIEANLFSRIRSAYLDLCERQIRLLQHEIAVEKAKSPDDNLEDFEREAAALAARLQARKAMI